MRSIVCVSIALALVGMAEPVRADAAREYDPETPWPSDVEGYVAPEPGEHPRLFFRKSDMALMKKKAQTPEGKAIIQRLRATLNGEDGESMPTAFNPKAGKQSKDGSGAFASSAPLGAYTMSHTAGFGLLYTLTGDKRYADLGKQCMDKAFEMTRDRDNRYSFKFPYGALRSGPSLGWTAVGYDLCYNGWDEEYRQKVAQALANYNEGRNMSLPELAKGSRHMPGSNHWGMQVGGAGLALLAIWKDPGVDNAKIEKLMDTNAKAMIRNVTEGFGDHGHFAEGCGTGSMSSQIAYISAIQAWKTAGGKDFISPRPNVPWTQLKWIFLTLPRKKGDKYTMDYPKRGGYPKNVWSRAGLSGGGYFGMGFGGVTEAQRAGLLWFYNHYLNEQDAVAGTPYDTPSPYPHHSVMAFINWPVGMKEMNPAEVIPRAVRCTTPKGTDHCLYMFRNRWQDENDIIISQQVKATRGWHRSGSDGSLQVWGMGKKEQWGAIPQGVTKYDVSADGSTIITGSGSCLGVDFSGASGAEAMLVMTGAGGSVSAGGNSFNFKFISSGAAPTPKPEGDKVIVGEQTVSVADGSIVFGTWAGPWEGPKAAKAVKPPSPQEMARKRQRIVQSVPAWDKKLISSTTAAVSSGKTIQCTMFKRLVTIQAMDSTGNMRLKSGGKAVSYNYSKLTPADKMSLAEAVVKAGNMKDPGDCAMAAFFCMLTGNTTGAAPYLKGAGAKGKSVKALFQ